MRHFATESGKSKGQFYTPAEVSRIMAQVIGIGAPTSAGPDHLRPHLRLRLAAAQGGRRGAARHARIYGQEMDNATWALARMNMILHDYPTAEIWHDNTLSVAALQERGRQPQDLRLRRRQSAVLDQGVDERPRPGQRRVQALRASASRRPRTATTPSCCTSSRRSRAPARARSSCRTACCSAATRRPTSAANSSSAASSRASSACRPTSSTAPASPPASSCSTRRTPHARTGIFMIDASKGFVKDGNKNRLRAQDIHKIVDVFTRQIELPRYSRMVPVAEIASPANDYNLNLPRYIDSSEPEDLQDIDAHLNGGIPDRDIDALERTGTVFPALRRGSVREWHQVGLRTA